MTGAVALAERLMASIVVDGAWVDARAEALAPGLTAVVCARTSVVGRPAGSEDLACVGADSAALTVLLDTFASAPLVLLVGEGQRTLAAAAAELAAAFDELCVQVAPEGPWLLAPLTRVLADGALTGDWRGAASWSAQLFQALAEGVDEPGGLPSDDAGLAALWGQAVADRQAIAVLQRAIAAQRGLLRDARRDLQRAGAEAELRTATHRHELAELRRTLDDERAWAAEQARRIGDSRAWRLGHGATRLAWRLTGRRARASDLPARIVERMQGPDPR